MHTSKFNHLHYIKKITLDIVDLAINLVQSVLKHAFYRRHDGLIVVRACSGKPGGGRYLGQVLLGYVPLAPQNPYPIIVYFSPILWSNIDPILVTFGYYSMFRVYFVAN